MNDDLFYSYLTKPPPLGGVGLHGEEATEITKRVFALMRYSRNVARFREEMTKDQMFLHQQKYIDDLMAFLKEELGLPPRGDQWNVLRAAVADRMGGITNASEFAERLALPFDMSGAAYSDDEAYRISRYLEKLIAQGGYVILPNELLGAHT
jgi:hypothetical protein